MGHLAPGEIFENILQLKRFSLYFEGILNRKWSLYSLVTNSTQRICLVARARLELVTFRSQSRRFPSTPHMSTTSWIIRTYMIMYNHII